MKHVRKTGVLQGGSHRVRFATGDRDLREFRLAFDEIEPRTVGDDSRFRWLGAGELDGSQNSRRRHRPRGKVTDYGHKNENRSACNRSPKQLPVGQVRSAAFFRRVRWNADRARPAGIDIPF